MRAGTRGLASLLLLCTVLVTGGSAVAGAGPDSIAVTYIGNEGFLLESGKGKILIDALYREGVSGYIVHPPERRDAMEGARPPFDEIDLVLATHFHADHFDAGAVAAHLRNNPGAVFVSTTQAVERLAADARGQETAPPRAVGVHPKEGDRFRRTVNGIDLQVINLHHGRNRPVQNLGFLATIGSWTVLHIGDTEATVDDFLLYELVADDIDLAFVPYWFLIDGKPADDLRRAIPADRIVVMHVPPRGSRAEHIEDLGGWEAMMDGIEGRFPSAVTFREPMQTRIFSRNPR